MDVQRTIYLIVGLLLLLGHHSFGQSEVVYRDGVNGLAMFISRNLKYPPNDRRNGLQGQVLVKLRVRDDHTIDSIAVLSSVTQAMDEEALRVLSLTNGNWTVKETKYFLLPIGFAVSEARYPIESMRRTAVQQLEKGNFERAIRSLNEIRRQDPFDLDNLQKLSAAYAKIGDQQNAMATNRLREDIEYFQKAERVIGNVPVR